MDMGDFMKLLNITKVQEMKNGQMSIVFPQDVKENAKRKGWNKGDKIELYEHGGGFFMKRNDAGSQANKAQEKARKNSKSK